MRTWKQTDTASRKTLALWRMDDSDHDPYGTSATHCMALCEALGFHGHEDLIPDALRFRPSPLGWALERDSEQWPDCEYADMIDAGELAPEDAARAAAVLGRYLDFVRLAGRDY